MNSLFDNIKPKVLVVDDNNSNLKVIGSLLYSEGYDTSFAHSGAEALEAVPILKPDLILLDIAMPEMDGIEACRILKSNINSKDIPIIFLTAKVESEDIINGFKIGAVDYITKPYNSTELLARVKTHVDLKMKSDLIIRQNQMLAELNSSKDRFFSIIAHDLKNPLGTFKQITRSLADDFDSFSIDERDYFLEEMKTHAEGIYALLENLLTWSSGQRGNLEFNPTDFNLFYIVQGTVNLLKPSADYKKIDILINFNQEITVKADLNMITTVIRNLISNSIKYTNHGGRIFIDATPENDYTLISIRDNGTGMTEDQISNLFKIDTNRSSYGTDGEKGTGLGLILCKEFIEKNGGKIWVESKVGIGTTFYCTIPKNK